MGIEEGSLEGRFFRFQVIFAEIEEEIDRTPADGGAAFKRNDRFRPSTDNNPFHLPIIFSLLPIILTIDP